MVVEEFFQEHCSDWFVGYEPEPHVHRLGGQSRLSEQEQVMVAIEMQGLEWLIVRRSIKRAHMKP